MLIDISVVTADCSSTAAEMLTEMPLMSMSVPDLHRTEEITQKIIQNVHGGADHLSRGVIWTNSRGTRFYRNRWAGSEVDRGKRAGISTDVAGKLKALERENRELRQAWEILRKALT